MQNIFSFNIFKRYCFQIFLLIFTAMVLFSLCLTLDAAAEPKSSLVYASTKDIRNINPHLYSGEMAAQNMVFESLVVNTMDGVKPWLAERWDVSPDGLEYIFYLRKGVTFSDGTPFNAEAVKLNIEAVIDNRSRHAWLELVNQIERGEAVDEHTYKLILKHPYYPTLIELGLTRPFRFISTTCFINGGTKEGVKGYIGTGPWVLSEHKDNQYAVFSRNPSYWGNATKLEKVEWRVLPDHQTIFLALQKGEVDMLFGADGDMIDLDSFEALRKQGKYTTLVSHPIASRAILLNASQPVTGDPILREAFQHVIDKKSITEGILNNTETIADTLLSRSVPYCDLDFPARTYDPDKAAGLMEKAGWITGKSGFREKDGKLCEVTLYFNAANAQERSISEFIQANFQKIGVKLQIVGEEKQAFLDRQRIGNFDLQYSLSWGPPYDPQSYISSWRIPAHGDYQAQVGLERKDWMDEVISKILIEPDDEKRQALYRELFTYIHDSGVYIPISYSRTKVVHKPELKGVTFNLSQYEIPFEKMFFE